MSGSRQVIARIVANHWRLAALGWDDQLMPGRIAAHPLSCVLAALDGQTDPDQLGIPVSHPDAELIRRLAGPPQ